jgi:hypothetical protein
MLHVVCDNFFQLIGFTPLVRLSAIRSDRGADWPHAAAIAALKFWWGKRVLAVLRHTGERHLSTELFS